MRLAHDLKWVRHTDDAGAFGRVAVLQGGDSSEREISLMSGKAVLAALERRGVDAHAFDPAERPLADLVQDGFDRVWIALHGPGGEDGTLQGALEYMGVPYTGSGVMGSAIAMDKLRTKRLAQAIGVATADCVPLQGERDFEVALERLKLPMIVKPNTQGSSVGITKVETAETLPAAFAAASRYDSVVFAEAWVGGGEYSVPVLKGEALSSIRITPTQVLYDYQAKYFRDDTAYQCPSDLSAPAERHLGALALAAFEAVGGEGWGRVDFRMDVTGRPMLLELNTIPGMTDHSLVPMGARARGMDFDTLTWRILETSFSRRRVA